MLRKDPSTKTGAPDTSFLHDLVQDAASILRVGDGPHVEGHDGTVQLHCVSRTHLNHSKGKTITITKTPVFKSIYQFPRISLFFLLQLPPFL